MLDMVEGGLVWMFWRLERLHSLAIWMWSLGVEAWNWALRRARPAAEPRTTCRFPARDTNRVLRWKISICTKPWLVPLGSYPSSFTSTFLFCPTLIVGFCQWLLFTP